ncbi:MAG TPA: DUF547 domain-containing protein [Pedobacter sp.]
MGNTPAAGSIRPMPINYIQLSQDFLYAARTGDSVGTYLDTLGSADAEQLSTQLKTDNEKLAFWLNMYNGFTQVLLKNNPEKYKSRSAFFSDKQILIAQHKLSLDMIEHGILRRSKIKWSLGYLNKPFTSRFERDFRVEKPDSRIHFALNCGAKSCPPIAFYDPGEIDAQLDLAMRAYLAGEAEFDTKTNIIKLPAIMGWFRGDFGGKKSMIELLRKNDLIPADSSPEIEFKKYDWTLFLNNYKS